MFRIFVLKPGAEPELQAAMAMVHPDGVALKGESCGSSSPVPMAALEPWSEKGNAACRAREIVERYYKIAATSRVALTLDAQLVGSPAYSRDRGPVPVLGHDSMLSFELTRVTLSPRR